MFGISISRFLQLQYLVLSNQNLTQKDTNKSTLAMNFYIVDVLIQFPFPHADDTGLFRRTMPQSIAITFTVISKAAKNQIQMDQNHNFCQPPRHYSDSSRPCHIQSVHSLGHCQEPLHCTHIRTLWKSSQRKNALYQKCLRRPCNIDTELL